MRLDNNAVIRLLLEAGADPVGCFDTAPAKILPKLEEYREQNRRPDPDFEIEENAPIYVSTVEDLPDDATNLLTKSGLLDELDLVNDNWEQFLVALRFLTRKRLKNGRNRKNKEGKPLTDQEVSEEEEDQEEDENGDKLTKEEKAASRKKAFSRVDHGWSLEEAYAKLVDPGNPLKLFTMNKEQIGRGGFGTVFQGRRVGNRREIAIKKISHLTDKEQWSNLDEIYFLDKLDHPCIVPYDSSYRYRDELWIIMEFLAGGTLSEVCKRNRLEEGHMAYLVLKMLEGIDYVHKQGYVHRDLKSANVMLDISGGVYLSAFIPI